MAMFFRDCRRHPPICRFGPLVIARRFPNHLPVSFPAVMSLNELGGVEVTVEGDWQQRVGVGECKRVIECIDKGGAPVFAP